jgi:hypothetical protein
LTKLEWDHARWSGVTFAIEGAFVERGGKEISLALVGKAHLVRLVIQSSVVIFKPAGLMPSSAWFLDFGRGKNIGDSVPR